MEMFEDIVGVVPCLLEKNRNECICVMLNNSLLHGTKFHKTGFLFVLWASKPTDADILN